MPRALGRSITTQYVNVIRPFDLDKKAVERAKKSKVKRSLLGSYMSIKSIKVLHE
jgi:hypothetical protein